MGHYMWSFTYVVNDIIDMGASVGWEKEGIEERPGCVWQWLAASVEGGRGAGAQKWLMAARRRLNDFDMTRVPDWKLEHLIESMDQAYVRCAVVSSWEYEFPFKGKKFLISIPPEYVKKCIDKYPDRLIGSAEIPLTKGKDYALKYIERVVKEFGFRRIIITPSTGFYPNDKDLCYPIYEKCIELGIPVGILTGVEAVPGARLKYSDPIYVDDVAVDFPDLKIRVAASGWMQNSEVAFALAYHNPNVYLTPSLPWPNLPMGWDFEKFKYAQELIPDRIMYASSAPFVYPHSVSIQYVERMPLTEEFKEQFFRENAKRYLGIK